MADLQGFMPPRSPEGRASILPPPPWHYSGDLLTIEYRTDPAAVAELLPDPIEPADEDPGAVALIFADWQSCSDSFAELEDPVRSQYKEAFVVVRCKYRGEHYSRCVYIWVDKDFALVRGWHQGYPKKLGSIWMTRPVRYGKAGPRLEPGGRFGASVAVHDRRIIDARVTLTGPSETNGFVNALPMLHNRRFPSIEPGGAPSMDEL
ncbi:MAG: acetoacetate decarboxylase family protein, partial [Actinomycetota bacterium]